MTRNKMQQVLRMRSRGYTMSYIAIEMQVSRKQLYEWLKRWNLPANYKSPRIPPTNIRKLLRPELRSRPHQQL